MSEPFVTRIFMGHTMVSVGVRCFQARTKQEQYTLVGNELTPNFWTLWFKSKGGG